MKDQLTSDVVSLSVRLFILLWILQMFADFYNPLHTAIKVICNTTVTDCNTISFQAKLHTTAKQTKKHPPFYLSLNITASAMCMIFKVR